MDYSMKFPKAQRNLGGKGDCQAPAGMIKFFRDMISVKEVARMGKFILRTTDGGFAFSLLAANGEPIAVSDVYTNRSACLKGLESVRRNAAAKVEDQSVRGFETLPNPKYELYRDRKRQYHYRLRARNGKIIAAGGGHTDKELCLKGIESVRRNAPKARVIDKSV